MVDSRGCVMPEGVESLPGEDTFPRAVTQELTLVEGESLAD